MRCSAISMVEVLHKHTLIHFNFTRKKACRLISLIFYLIFSTGFYLDLVVDCLFGSTTSGAARNVDIVPRERRIVRVLVHVGVVRCRPCIVKARAKRNAKRARRVVRGTRRDADGERGNHGCVCLSLMRNGGFNFFS